MKKKSSMKRTYLYLSFHQKSKQCYRKGLFGKRVFCVRVCAHVFVFLFCRLGLFFLNTYFPTYTFLSTCVGFSYSNMTLKTKYCSRYTLRGGGVVCKSVSGMLFWGLSLISYHKPKILGQTCTEAIKINKEQSIPEVKILQYQNYQHN